MLNNKARFFHIVALIILMPLPLIFRTIYITEEDLEIIKSEAKQRETKSFISENKPYDNVTEAWIDGKVYFYDLMKSKQI